MLALGFRSKGGQVPQGRKEESVEARAKRAQPKRSPFPTDIPQGLRDPLGNAKTKTLVAGLVGAQAAEESILSAPPPLLRLVTE